MTVDLVVWSIHLVNALKKEKAKFQKVKEEIKIQKGLF
jgi:hypothetical protein